MLDWKTIDSVLLDMDGTLIDQRFDNYFFLELVPMLIAQREKRSIKEVYTEKSKLYQQYTGTLDFYCLDFWTDKLQLDIRALKRQCVHLIKVRAGVENFLQRLCDLKKHLVLVTNAHPDSMNLKLQHTNLRLYFNRYISVHEIGLPKENKDFWHKLQAIEPFTPEKTLFIDDNLPMLDAAKEYKIKHLFAIKKPDSAAPEKDTGNYYGLTDFAEITPHD